MDNCVFCKIARGELPSRKIHEDADLMAFHDIHPQAPVHFLVIPKLHIESLAHLDDSHQAVMGKLMLLISRLAKQQGLGDGFRTIANTGRVGRQEVMHIHFHVVGGGPHLLPVMLARAS